MRNLLSCAGHGSTSLSRGLSFLPFGQICSTSPRLQYNTGRMALRRLNNQLPLPDILLVQQSSMAEVRCFPKQRAPSRRCTKMLTPPSNMHIASSSTLWMEGTCHRDKSGKIVAGVATARLHAHRSLEWWRVRVTLHPSFTSVPQAALLKNLPCVRMNAVIVPHAWAQFMGSRCIAEAWWGAVWQATSYVTGGTCGGGLTQTAGLCAHVCWTRTVKAQGGHTARAHIVDLSSRHGHFLNLRISKACRSLSGVTERQQHTARARARDVEHAGCQVAGIEMPCIMFTAILAGGVQICRTCLRVVYDS